MRRALILALPLLLAAADPPRDWKESPAILQIDTPGDVYAAGDIHGDYERFTALLTGAGVIARVPKTRGRAEWNAGAAVLVVTGDMIDKGPDAVGVLAFLRSLTASAAAAGGRVVVLMGNHEAEFLAGPSASKGAEFAGQLKAAGLEPKDVAACGGDLGRYLCSLPLAVRVNDWFFSHAGNTAGRTLPQLAADLEGGVSRDGFASRQLIGDNSILEARIGEKGPGGRAWFEAGGSRIPAARLLADYAAALGVHHIVEGHHHAKTLFPDGASRKPGEMFNWRGELFLIDTGMSRDIGDSAGSLLHIRTAQKNAAVVCPDGRETALWDARLPERTAAAGPCRERPN